VGVAASPWVFAQKLLRLILPSSISMSFQFVRSTFLGVLSTSQCGYMLFLLEQDSKSSMLVRLVFLGVAIRMLFS
jgi:hypothetical protein